MRKQTGARRMTPALDRARAFAEITAATIRVPKTDAATAARDVLAELGVPVFARSLFEKLLEHSQKRDWLDPGSRPLVWPSNEKLALQMGRCCVRTVQNGINALIQAGVIAPHDSANGKRHGRRVAGVIVEAHGLDLTPTMVRFREFTDLQVKLQRQRREILAARKEVTKASRRIEIVVAAGLEQDLPGEWDDYLAQRERIENRHLKRSRTVGESHERIKAKLHEMGLLADMVEDAYREGNRLKERQNHTPLDAESFAHIQLTTNPLEEVLTNEDSGERATSRRVGKAAPKAPGLEPGETVERSRARPRPAPAVRDITLDLVCLACPELNTLDGGVATRWPAGTWVELSKMADRTRPLLGISADAWTTAREKMGWELAAVSIAVITQKHATGVVKNPGGYLRAMVERHETKALNISRSIQGLVAEQLKPRLENPLPASVPSSVPNGPPLRLSPEALAGRGGRTGPRGSSRWT